MFDPNSSRSKRQKECVDNWIKSKCVGSIVGATGFGKTRIGLQAVQRFQNKNANKKVIIVVPSDAIKIQWDKELQDNNIRAEVHTMYDVSRNQYKCALLVIDEVHKVAAPTLYSVFENVEYKIILGLTATFERLDGNNATLKVTDLPLSTDFAQSPLTEIANSSVYSVGITFIKFSLSLSRVISIVPLLTKDLLLDFIVASVTLKGES